MPTRTCVACRQKEEKDKVFRFVLSKEREITFDLLSILSGRGCYLHYNCLAAKNGLNAVSVALGLNGKRDRKCNVDLVSSLEKFLLEANKQLIKSVSARCKSVSEAKLRSLEMLLRDNRDKIKEAKIRL